MTALVDQHPGHSPACRVRTGGSVCTCLPREGRQVATAAPDNHKLARKLLERERDQARQDVAEAAGWVREYETDRAKAEKRLADAIAAIAWLDDQAGDQR